MDEVVDLGAVKKYLTSEAFIGSVIVVIVSFLIQRALKRYIIKKSSYTGKSDQHKNTLIGVALSGLRYLIDLQALATIMGLHGIRMSGIMASLGVAAMIVGLSLQDTLKDIFSGINIYTNNFYKVGDIVRWNGEECDVKFFSVRVTKFQSIKTSSTYTVCNSQITSIEKVKDGKSISVIFPFETDKAVIEKCFNKAIEKTTEIHGKNVKKLTYIGPIGLTDGGIRYGADLTAPAHKSEAITITMYQNLIDECKANGIKPDGE